MPRSADTGDPVRNLSETFVFVVPTVPASPVATATWSGGIKPLTDRDKREIQATARKVLAADRHPEATFSASSFEPAADGGVIAGTMTIAGKSGPLRLTVTKSGPDTYQATTSIVQTAF